MLSKQEAFDMYGENLLTECQYKSWFANIRSGNVEDGACSGRTFKVVVDKAMINENCRIISLEILDIINIREQWIRIRTKWSFPNKKSEIKRQKFIGT